MAHRPRTLAPTLFLTSAPLLAPSGTLHRRPCAGPRRPPLMHSSPRPPSDDASAASFGRFREFTSSGGDAATQNNLVREVLWQAARAATTETLESAIRGELDAVSDLLTNMYSRSERELRLRQEELAMRTSLPNISKWNQQLIEGHKRSKIHRSEIDKELAIVDAMLRRNQRGSRRRKRGAALVTREQRAGAGPRPSGLRRVNHSLREALSAQGNKPAQLAFTMCLAVTAIDSFEKIAAQTDGPSHLAKYAALSALAVLLVAHFHATRAAVAQQEGELDPSGAAVQGKEQHGENQ